MNRTFFIVLASIYATLFALLLVPVALGYEMLEDNSAGLVILISSLIFLAVVIFINYRKNKKVIALLHHKCDPDAFIEQTQRQYNKMKSRGTIPYVLMLRLNLGAGLSAAGRFYEALAAMQFDAALIKSNYFGRLMRLTYHQNHFSCFISLGMLEHARDALLWLNDAVNAEKDGKLEERIRRWYKNDYYRYEMEHGRFDGAEAVFQEMFDRAENNYHRVLSMYTLGLVHEHFGRLDKARKAFEYVTTHGNKLHAVVSAKERLASMGNA